MSHSKNNVLSNKFASRYSCSIHRAYSQSGHTFFRFLLYLRPTSSGTRFRDRKCVPSSQSRFALVFAVSTKTRSRSCAEYLPSFLLFSSFSLGHFLSLSVGLNSFKQKILYLSLMFIPCG